MSRSDLSVAAVVVLLLSTGTFADRSQAETTRSSSSTSVAAATDVKRLAGEAYQLGVGDTLKLTIFEREDLSKEYEVNEDGALRIPLIGDFKVKGWTVPQLERELRKQYQVAFNRDPQLIVELSKRRPFFVVGLVNNPGSYPYYPRMSALHAVAFAGGIYRLASNNYLAADAQRETTRLVQSREDLKRALARLARARAEKSNAKRFSAPKRLIKLAGNKEASELVTFEQSVLNRRRRAYARRIEAFKTNIKLSKDEATVLRRQIKSIEKQRDLTAKHSADISALNRRGLANRAQLLTMRRDLSLLERDYQTAVVGVSRAQQALAEHTRDYTLFQYNYELQLEQSISDLELEIKKLEASIRGSRRFVQQATGRSVSVGERGQPGQAVNYIIVRQVGAETKIIQASETTRLLPGDILRVVAVE